MLCATAVLLNLANLNFNFAHAQNFYSDCPPLGFVTIQFNMAIRFLSEPRRRSAYSEDLRWKMVWQREVQGFTLKRIASNLMVDISTVHRTCRKFRQTGSVAKKKYSAALPQILTKPVQLTILKLILQNPCLYLRELQIELYNLLGSEISISTICNFLKKMNFSRKKINAIASQMDEALRSQFVLDVSLYDANCLIFIDETGCDRRITRRYGYGLKGKPIK